MQALGEAARAWWALRAVGLGRFLRCTGAHKHNIHPTLERDERSYCALHPTTALPHDAGASCIVSRTAGGGTTSYCLFTPPRRCHTMRALLYRYENGGAAPSGANHNSTNTRVEHLIVLPDRVLCVLCRR